MLELIPQSAFFQFELPIRYLPETPPIDADLTKWSDAHRVPFLKALDDQEPFARVWWGWNDDYFVAAFGVRKTGPVTVDSDQWWKKDGIRLCIDTRDARDLKRGTRFCHLFYLLPTGGGERKNQPIVGLHKLNKAKESPPRVDPAQLRLAARVERSAYRIEVAIPTGCLNGFDPVEHPRIGIYYKIKDTQVGAQHLCASDDLGWNSDPSVWATGVLVR